MQKQERIYLSPPHMGGREQAMVAEAFASNWIAPLGPFVERFESDVAKRLGMPCALAVNAGTAAIHLALRALGVGPGDTVFCSDLTFVASVNPVVYLGATPVFIDAEAPTLCMSPEALIRAFRSERQKPKAVIVVDLYGFAPRYEEIEKICRAYDTPLIEDACEALGSRYRGQACGSFGEMGTFSFNGNKIITSSGGGMVVGRNEALFKTMLHWATQAREPALHYQHAELGYNYRLSNICAAIGCGQLEALDDHIAARHRNHAHYRLLLEDLPLHLVEAPEGCESNDWMNVAVIDKRSKATPADLVKALDREDIEARPVWKPMHAQPLFDGAPFYAHDAGERSVGTSVFARGICLPSGSSLREKQRLRVVETLAQAL